MSIETAIMHVTPVGGNVFVDLGFESGEANALKEESDRVIALKLKVAQSPGNENYEGISFCESKE